MTDKEKNNREELFRLMQENPDLPVVPMVDSEIVADDCGYWLGSWGRACVDEYFISEQAERVFFKSDDDVFDVLERHVDEKYYIDDEKAQTIIAQALEKLESLGKVHACLTPDRENKRQNGPRAKEDEAEMFTLTAQDIHGVIVCEEELDDTVQCICEETGLLNPNGCGKTLRVGGGGSLTKKHNYQHVLVWK